MSGSDIKASKWLSLVLRHDPGRAGLIMDGGGWVAIDAILRASPHLQNIDDLTRIVTESEKGRFAISEDGQRIRARQGHSISVDLGFQAQTPPDTLFHGTATRFLDTILAKGLKRMSRQYVHLSLDEPTARSVGRRHGHPVILQVQSGTMAADGSAFYLSENGVWLTDTVAPQYLHVLPEAE